MQHHTGLAVYPSTHDACKITIRVNPVSGDAIKAWSYAQYRPLKKDFRRE